MSSNEGVFVESEKLQQDEELQIIKSIFPNEFHIIDPTERTYKLIIEDDTLSGKISLQFSLPKGYPSQIGPDFNISAPNMPKEKHQDLYNTLKDVCSASVGTPVIYSMIETIRSFLNDLSISSNLPLVQKPEPHALVIPLNPVANVVYRVPSVRDHLAAGGERLPMALGVVCPPIFRGETITDRKSVFQAHCCRVSSLPEVSAFISTMLEDRKVASATHNITSWYLQATLKPDASKSSLVADFDDDGETHAGSRLLHLITMIAVEGVAVMVTRWYGGIQLGPDRFKHINNAASQLLRQEKLTKGTISNRDIKTNQSKKRVNKKK